MPIDINESTRSWSFLLFKDFVAHHGDELLDQRTFQTGIKCPFEMFVGLKVLKATIETIVEFLPKGKGSKIRSSTLSADFLALKKSIQKIYNDNFILENMKDILKDEHIHELVRDEVFAPVEKLK